jgi:transposase-like protein
MVSKIFEMSVKSSSTIWYWSKEFAKKFCKIIEGLSDLLHADETKIKTNVKGHYLWLWASKCPKTKTIVGYHISESRTQHDAKLLFWEARRRFPVGYWPKTIRTDGFHGYKRAIYESLDHKVKHDKFLSFKEHSNNEIETFFRCKHRFPRFRTIESARRYIAHWISEHNAEKLGDDYFWVIFIIRRLNVTMFI